MKTEALKIYRLLKEHYPRARIALKYKSPWELLVATVLSAQCTDKRVNMVTEKLFAKYRSVKEYASADINEFENDIRSTGFFRNKSRNILDSAKIILKKHKGEVPRTMEDLTALPGIGRKTANIISCNAFGKIFGIAVDTHVGRLSQRLGLSGCKDPLKIEQDLMRSFPKKDWGRISYLFIEHGRAVCAARKPDCDICFLKGLCPRKPYSK
ncbi:MAG: endonuclease III [Candidatus Omnitrophota bacterium]|nr:endonuclease III [Candidatus Omnitrophota bacterium]MBU2528726.1 endonuclease III [bacterium]MBU3929383.1 endonuclease III [bacterium]MBU4123399.1 endonuclease III [bacterium]